VTFLVALIIGYGVLVTGLAVFQRRLLYLPDTRRPEPDTFGVPEMTTVSLSTDDGLILEAWYSPAEPGCPTLTYFHGNGSHLGYRGPRVRPYLDAGFGVLLVGYRGYGGNPGRPSEDGLYRDARAAFDFLHEAAVADRQIVIYGESLGTTVAVRMAAERAEQGRPAGALVLEAPLSSVVDVAAHHYPWAPVRWLLKDRFEAVARIGHVGTPVLIVHGDRDWIVPIRFGRRLYEAAVEPKRARWIRGGGHEDLDRHGISANTFAFLADHGLGAGACDGGSRQAPAAVMKTP
jgi:hypothetical protein